MFSMPLSNHFQSRLNRRLFCWLIAGALAIVAPGTLAASSTWSATPSSGFWQLNAVTDNNWSTGVNTFPVISGTTTSTSADVATFLTSSTLTLRTGTGAAPTTGINIGGLTFGNGTTAANAFIIGSAVGDGTLQLSDTATITLSAASAATQTINSNIILGSVAVGTTTITANAGTVLNITGNITGGTIAGTAAVKTLAIAGAAPVNISGVINRGGGTAVTLTDTNSTTLTLSGASTISLLNVNNATAIVDFGAGTFTITPVAAGGSSIQSTTGGTINASGGGSLILTQNTAADGGNNGTASGTTLTINAKITGANCFESFVASANTGTMVLANAANNFTGSVLINSGIISVAQIGNSGNPSPLGTNGTIQVSTGTNTGATLKYTGTGETTNKVLTFLGTTAGPTLDMSGTGTLEFTNTGVIATGAGAKTVTLQGSTAGIGQLDSILANNTAANTTAVTKTGTGTWILNGVNTYTGLTTVSQGTLIIPNGTAGALTITGNTTATKYFGSGSIGGAVTLNSGTSTSFATGPSLNPGNASVAGTLTVNFPITTNAYSVLGYDLSSSTVSGNDLILTNTQPAFNGPTQIAVNTLGTLTVGNVYTLISGYSGKLPASSFNNLALSTFTGADTAKSGILINDFGQLLLKITAGAATGSLFWSGAVDNNWQTVNPATIWSTSTSSLVDPLYLPTLGQDVHFYTANPLGINLTPTIATGVGVNSVTFDGGALTSPVTINGGTLTINGVPGMTVASGAGAITVNSIVNVPTSQTWTNNSANPLTLNGGVVNPGTLSVAGTGASKFGGTISGAGGLTLNGSAPVTFSASNTFAGNTAINTTDTLTVLADQNLPGGVTFGLLSGAGTAASPFAGSATNGTIDSTTKQQHHFGRRVDGRVEFSDGQFNFDRHGQDPDDSGVDDRIKPRHRRRRDLDGDLKIDDLRRRNL